MALPPLRRKRRRQKKKRRRELQKTLIRRLVGIVSDKSPDNKSTRESDASFQNTLDVHNTHGHPPTWLYEQENNAAEIIAVHKYRSDVAIRRKKSQSTINYSDDDTDMFGVNYTVGVSSMYAASTPRSSTGNLLALDKQSTENVDVDHLGGVLAQLQSLVEDMEKKPYKTEILNTTPDAIVQLDSIGGEEDSALTETQAAEELVAMMQRMAAK
eukprot:CFRG6286T1